MSDDVHHEPQAKCKASRCCCRRAGSSRSQAPSVARSPSGASWREECVRAAQRKQRDARSGGGSASHHFHPSFLLGGGCPLDASNKFYHNMTMFYHNMTMFMTPKMTSWQVHLFNKIYLVLCFCRCLVLRNQSSTHAVGLWFSRWSCPLVLWLKTRSTSPK